ncbi:hypothetical protein N7491_004148 [Penicillium cf. griseofulvum]|nr:hypothetical protein N7491_004148 [Penicillium cf. griseofulvum]
MTEKNAPLGASNATKSRSYAGKDTSVKGSQTAAKAETGSGSHSSPKKRRKVNHACDRVLGTADSVAHNDKNIANECFPQFQPVYIAAAQ